MTRRFGLRHGPKMLCAALPLGLVAALAGAPAVAGENYALIVAASQYSNLDAKYWLKGPANDAILVRDYLLGSAPVKFAPEHVETLATGPGLTNPTHDAIVAGLKRLAGETGPGDFVYLHFSGHGSQQPATDDVAEPDGRDEIFLPSDTKIAAGSPFLPNALSDNEVGAALTAIRKTGAFVWVVFDSCYSGTMTRGAPTAEEGFADRKIDPADLGIPDSAFRVVAATDDSQERVAPISAAALADDPTDDGEGGLVAFFAAQSTQTTQERNMPIGQPDGSTVQMRYGVFTYSLFSALAKNPNRTYRQLAQSVLQTYAANNTTSPTPLFEGTLDAPVFGSTEVANAEQWQTTVAADGTLGIEAGQLQGLGKGTKLLVLPTPAATNAEALGVVEVKAATTLRSTLVPSSDETHQPMTLGDVPAAAYVRLATQSYDFALSVARPDVTGGDPEAVGAVNSALDAIMVDPDKAMQLKVVEAGASADVRLAVLSEGAVAALEGDRAFGAGVAPADPAPKLWLLPASGQISLAASARSPEMAIPAAEVPDGAFTKSLSDKLVTIFRANGLARLAASNSFAPGDFSMSFEVQRAGGRSLELLAPETTPRLASGDQLHVEFDNQSGKPIDLNVLYIDHDYGITPICRSHLAVGDHLFAPMARLNDSDLGSERIVAVVNEAGKEMTDLSFLKQGGIAEPSRGAGDLSLPGLIAALGAGQGGTRGPTALSASAGNAPRGAVVMVPLEVLPASGPVTPADPKDLEGGRVQTGSCG